MFGIVYLARLPNFDNKTQKHHSQSRTVLSLSRAQLSHNTMRSNYTLDRRVRSFLNLPQKREKYQVICFTSREAKSIYLRLLPTSNSLTFPTPPTSISPLNLSRSSTRVDRAEFRCLELPTQSSYGGFIPPFHL